jgi:hypothetical protein
MEQGDYVLIFILAIGLAFTPFALQELKKLNKSALIYFLIAIVFSIMAVVADSFDLHHFEYDFQKLLQYFEEVAETTAQIFFINSFFCAAVSSWQRDADI